MEVVTHTQSAAPDVAHQFMELFSGRTDAFGTGDGPVERREPTVATYMAHLAGEPPGLGIFPMRDDNTVLFAAIDLDEPNFELARTMQKLVPGQSWIERSRSGNAHVWVFFNGSVPAWVVRTILRGATEAVGRPDVEIFPKQDGLRPGGVGNFINLPYFGDTRPMLYEAPEYAPPGTLQEMTLTSFLKTAPERLQDPEAWERRARSIGGKPPEERERSSEWGTAPKLHMCAKKIMAERETNPVMPGSRHQVLFHVACQFLNWRDCDAQEAWEWVVEINEASPKPLSHNELDRLFQNAEQGQFTFTGCDDPVMQPYVHPDCPIAHG